MKLMKAFYQLQIMERNNFDLFTYRQGIGRCDKQSFE